MEKIITSTLALFLFAIFTIQLHAQSASSSDNLVAQPIPDRIVPFDLTDPGVSKTVEFGPDLAWANEQNFRRVIRFMGLDQVDIVRASFQPTYALVNGQLTQAQIDDLDYRLSLINTYVGPNTDLALNCDHPFVDDWYLGFPDRWEQLIEVSTQRYLNAGHNVVTVGAFNEPDYGWGQGSAQDMYDITALLNSNPLFSNIRLSGGNTLNCDEAQGWYDFLVPAGVNEGNTHQLAGSFDSFASFFQNVRANGHHASGDELHNVVEGLVGYEYGMQTGIWWAAAEYARGEMVKAFDGERIGYAEHRPNWTAAAVYRTPEGKVQAFGGTSERQAVTTTYNYISKDRLVYYDGYGPQREFVLEMPGGTGYWTGQTNAERVVNITWGDDIQPVIDGSYYLVNRATGQVMDVNGNIAQDGANVELNAFAGASSQQWNVTPVDSRIGGDFSYWRIQPASNSDKSLDLYNFSLDNGANLNLWTNGNQGNQQWYLDYAEDGWFYIRSRESSYCVSAESGGTNIEQWEKTGNTGQQWRFLPVGAPLEFTAPAAPLNLSATAHAVSIQLDWSANSESDLAGYSIFRATAPGGPYNTIARGITANSFVDNTTQSGTTYYYALKAVDNSLNRSGYSNQVSATASGNDALVTHFEFEQDTRDNSVNFNHAAVYGGTSFVASQAGTDAIALNGSDAFLQLPPDIANHQEISVATWVYWDGGGAWQRIFDFGNGTDQNLFLTPSTWNGELQFGLINGGTQQNLYSTGLPTGQWVHVAVTLGASGVRMYVDGQEVAQQATAVVSPLDFKPVLNYIGRSQYPDPLFDGTIEDFRIYNYALSAGEVADLAGLTGGTFMAVESITTGTANAGQGKKRGTAQVLIQDHLNNPVAGATVTGTFSGSFSETVNGVTAANGIVSFQTSGTAKGNVTVDFCVDDVTHATLPYDPLQNQISCTNGSARLTNGIGGIGTEGLAIFPIPTRDILNIHIQENDLPLRVSVADLLGKTILKVRLTNGQNQLNLKTLQAGVYLLRIEDETGIIDTQRIIKN
ncbi:LamG-like jellyroll fold domain-containing protein [Flavilitoribacter nigricans]|uniref:Ricin-type beta-trefoil lectin domain protein n=1 Tax=Flavilitoribacter nigricans (strain ATCC 23147 / DSM 23189 / NBRC 102662 / NCIMB 1420 / SS-2) TaxID=1122177 RepID=A0A2D0NJV0_FLAN2|nr:LamG-like jellyroll fold domain-containing protein [Flavilitoribacter nigricans]PHN08670.1 ricin-type beta-trefoil lectin domain protein [Flavilitoribacter nigricans DSM 23189 = NBRC 102662]